MAKNIIIFQNEPGEENTLLGFKILDINSTKQYMKAVSLLSNANEKFEINNMLIDYEMEKFEILKITAGDIKVLSKLFNVGEDEETAGIFPDAINDAYELGLLSDDDEYNEYNDEDFDENYE